MAEKMRMDDERSFGITKLKLHIFSLAALEMILGDIVVKVSSMIFFLGHTQDVYFNALV